MIGDFDRIMISCFGSIFNWPAAQKKSEVKSGGAAKRIKARHLESGVNHLLLLAIIESVPETYQNVKKVLDKLNLQSNSKTCEFKLTADLKLDMANLANILCPCCLG